MTDLKRTGLYSAHTAASAKIVPFAGFEMPLQYTSIREEHEAVRNAAGLFDVSHMGEIRIKGPDALVNIQRLISNDVSKALPGRVIYSGLLYENGTFVDDLLVYKFQDDDFLICVNASNNQKDYQWMLSQISGNLSCENVSDHYTQIAIQGPKSTHILQQLTQYDLSKLKYYRFAVDKVDSIPCLISRTGYTGEIGYELYFDPSESIRIWNKLLDKGKSFDIKPAGLGCRDTLRLEAGMALYGNDIDDSHTPLEARLDWTVKMEKADFIGRPVLERQMKEGLTRKLTGFELIDRGVPRHGYEVYSEKACIGVVTSGTLSITLNKPVGLAYVQTGFDGDNCEFFVKIRDKMLRAKTVKYPFYSKTH